MPAARPSASVSLPDRDQVDLWTADLGASAQELRSAAAILSPAELERFERVIRPAVREHLIVARALLRRLLGSYLGQRPEAVTLARGVRGKPSLDPDPGLSFNLSHSGALAVVAVTTRAAVGIDTELLGRSIRPGVLRRALAPAELQRVLTLDPAERDELFLVHWTAKEAYAKALGQGLSIGMASVELEQAAEELVLADPQARAEFSLQRFDPRPGAVGAVAVEGGPWQARRRRIAELWSTPTDLAPN